MPWRHPEYAHNDTETPNGTGCWDCGREAGEHFGHLHLLCPYEGVDCPDELRRAPGYPRPFSAQPTPAPGTTERGLSLRELQVRLPWTIRYSADFRASPMAHKDFSHALHHVGKALGRLHALADDMDHDRDAALQAIKETNGKYVADLVVCALRLANVFPGGGLDLQRAVVERIEQKNGVKL